MSPVAEVKRTAGTPRFRQGLPGDARLVSTSSTADMAVAQENPRTRACRVQFLRQYRSRALPLR